MDNRITNSQINNIYNTPNNNDIKDKEEMSFQDQINDTVKKLYEKAKDDRVVPDYGDFTPVSEYFENMDEKSKQFLGKYCLRVAKMPKDTSGRVEYDPKQKVIEAAAYHPSGRYKAEFAVGAGHKEDILKKLQDPEFAEHLNSSYAKLYEALKDEYYS